MVISHNKRWINSAGSIRIFLAQFGRKEGKSLRLMIFIPAVRKTLHLKVKHKTKPKILIKYAPFQLMTHTVQNQMNYNYFFAMHDEFLITHCFPHL